MFQMCGVFAEFEQSMIRERVNAGLSRARANGKQLGRPSVGEDIEKPIRLALRRGDKGMRKIAREPGVGVSVVQRVSAGVSGPCRSCRSDDPHPTTGDRNSHPRVRRIQPA
jgi:DNA invertase Pin-like site-specific DNA recombinase